LSIIWIVLKKSPPLTLPANGSSFALSVVHWVVQTGRRGIGRDRSCGMLSSTLGSFPVPRRVLWSVLMERLLVTLSQHSILLLAKNIKETGGTQELLGRGIIARALLKLRVGEGDVCRYC
jgi:hypothetical protein